MELFGGAIVGVLAQAMVTGGAEEAGRSAVASLTDLLRRLRRRGGPGGGDGALPLLPRGDPERARQAAHDLVRLAQEDDTIAAILLQFLREHPGAALPPQRISLSYADFVNRTEQVAKARRLVADAPARPRLLFLLGEHGIGKTALARHLSTQLTDVLPDHHFYLDLGGDGAGGPLAPGAALTDLLQRTGVYRERIPARLPDQQELARRLLARRRTLLVLDHAESAEQVIPLLLGAPGSLTVVASRRRMPRLARDYGAQVLPLGPLAGPDAEDLLTLVAGGEETVAVGGGAARETLRRCGGIPARICDAGARVQMDGPAAWAELARDAGPGAAPATATEAAYARLTAGAARLHRLLGRLPRVPLGVPAAAALAGLTPAAARAALGELAALRLLAPAPTGADARPPAERPPAERHQLTPRAHRHAAAQPEPDGDQAVRDWLTWCLRTAAEAETSVMLGRWYLGGVAGDLARRGAVYPHRKTALDVLSRERQVLGAAVRAAAERDLHAYVWQLCESMWGLHLRLGFHEDCLATHALGMSAARALGDRRAQARMLVQRGFSLMALGRHEEADAAFTAALTEAEPEDHPRGKATALESLGLLRLRQGRAAEAEGLFRQALPFAERAGEPRAVALLAHHIGRALLGQDRHPAALAQLDRALSAIDALPLPDRYNRGRVLTSLGEARLTAGYPAAAAQALDEALDIMADEEGALVQEAAVTELRARCEPDADRRLALRERARRLYDALGDADGAERLRRLLRDGDGNQE